MDYSYSLNNTEEKAQKSTAYKVLFVNGVSTPKIELCIYTLNEEESSFQFQYNVNTFTNNCSKSSEDKNIFALQKHLNLLDFKEMYRVYRSQLGADFWMSREFYIHYIVDNQTLEVSQYKYYDIKKHVDEIKKSNSWFKKNSESIKYETQILNLKNESSELKLKKQTLTVIECLLYLIARFLIWLDGKRWGSDKKSEIKGRFEKKLEDDSFYRDDIIDINNQLAILEKSQSCLKGNLVSTKSKILNNFIVDLVEEEKRVKNPSNNKG